MIGDIFFGTMYFTAWLLTSPLRAFDDVSLPADMTSALVTANTYLSYLGLFLDLTSLVVVIGLMSSIEIGIAGYKLINFVIRKIPGIS